MQFREIEAAFSQLKACPKCESREGFWLGLRHDRAYVQCKGCGKEFELFKVYKVQIGERSRSWLSFFRK